MLHSVATKSLFDQRKALIAWTVSLVLLVATIYGILAVCSRIYRVGILMYGKRPTLPEILKWLKYA